MPATVAFQSVGRSREALDVRVDALFDLANRKVDTCDHILTERCGHEQALLDDVKFVLLGKRLCYVALGVLKVFIELFGDAVWLVGEEHGNVSVHEALGGAQQLARSSSHCHKIERAELSVDGRALFFQLVHALLEGAKGDARSLLFCDVGHGVAPVSLAVEGRILSGRLCRNLSVLVLFILVHLRSEWGIRWDTDTESGVWRTCMSEAVFSGSSAVLNALRERRSTARVTDEPPPRRSIECLLEAATWAPNHYRTMPWRFAVVTGDGRRELGEVMARSLVGRLDRDGGAHEDRTAQMEKERRKPLRAPVVVAVACVPASGMKVEKIEEVCAVAAGVQNMLIAADALGLGAMWRTGAPARDPAVKRFLGFPESATIVAFVYVGYADLVSQHIRERDPAPYTTWLGEYAE
jgi:nitroreductase